jgi:thioester reductase-like protein
VLEPGISPHPATPRASAALGDAGSVFLTGATGFLGAFLLDGLLSRTDAKVYCLVRSRAGDPAARVRENLARYGLPYGLSYGVSDGRVVPVVGDLGEPLLGVAEEDFDALAREVDAVVHAGAAVNLIYPYHALKAANVEGTREVLRLACRHKTKPLHHVSTNGIFPPNVGACLEDADLDALAGAREDGYGQSKWVAEKLVREAAGRGLPVRVYRPGNVSGHSRSGASNPNDLLGAVIVASVRLGVAPEIEGWRMEMTPVDGVTDAVLRIAGRADTAYGAFHLANPDPPSAAAVFDAVEDLGYPLRRVPLRDWLSALRAAPSGTVDDLAGVLGGHLDPAELRDGNAHDDRNTRRVLGGRWRRPGIGPDLLRTYLEHFAERGWIRPSPALQRRDSA